LLDLGLSREGLDDDLQVQTCALEKLPTEQVGQPPIREGEHHRERVESKLRVDQGPAENERRLAREIVARREAR
jgi:hypothetical protein